MLSYESILLSVAPEANSRIQTQVVCLEADVRKHQWESKEVR